MRDSHDGMMNNALSHPVKAMCMFALVPFLMECLRGAQGISNFLRSLVLESPPKTTDYASDMTSAFVLMGILGICGVMSAFARGKRKSLRAKNIVSALFLGAGVGLGTAAAYKIGLLALGLSGLFTFVGWILFSNLTSDEEIG